MNDHLKMLETKQFQIAKSKILNFKKILFFILAFTILFSCRTQKSRNDELTGMKKLWHNMNAKFNGYFNADVLMEESILELEQSHQDNYTKILPTYKYVAADNVQEVSKKLDEAIEKVSIVATLHKQSNWTDDCYLAIGKSQYLKKDYESAEETLEYMLKHYSPSAIAKRAKEAARKKARAKGKKLPKQPSSKKEGLSDEEAEENERREALREMSAKQRKKIRDKENKAVQKKKKKERKEREKARKRKKKGKKAKKKKSDAPKTVAKKKEEPKDPIKKIVKEEPSKKELKKLKENPNTNPENYFMKHKPAHTLGKLWLARTLIERDKFDDADRMLQQIQGQKDLDKDILSEIPAARAHLFLKQKKYAKAIPFLEEAINLGGDRKQRSRYAYILAQIYQTQKQSDKAVANFQKAMRLTNDYEMQFSAKLSMVENAYATGKETLVSTRRNLKRMLKDYKNVDYKDQIYFVLGELALKNGERPIAIENFTKALAASTKNNAQKAETYLKLANLYYEEESFVDAKNYFDSTLIVLNTTDDRYKDVVKYATDLKEIAENLEIVNLQDSLLRISEMSIADQKALAKKIKKERAEIKAAASAAIVNTAGSKYKNNTGAKGRGSSAIAGRGGPNPTGTSNFWAYNEKNLKKGKKDFDKRWQNRKLEDNWRRASRQSVTDIASDETEEAEESLNVSDSELQQIFKDVPQTEEAKKQAHKAMENAYFELGKLFREKIERNDKTVENHEAKLLKDYPDTEHQMIAWYYLYMAHTDLGNRNSAKEYYDKLVKKYPESSYARIISDPDYANKFLEEKNKLDRYYNETYSIFKKSNYKEVIDRINNVESTFGPTNIMMPKFYLLKAMAVGNVEGKDEYIKSLKEVVAKYPKTEEETRAKEILRLLGDASVKSKPKTAEANKNPGTFTVEDDKLHYVLVVITDKGEVKVTDAKASIASFHRNNFKLDKLRLSNIFLGTDVEKPLIVIRKFKNRDLVMNYVKAAQEAGIKYIPEGMEYTIYPVTQNNYRQILRAKTLDGYDTFYQDNY